MNTDKHIPSKKKVFFVISSLSSGGSERVFWNIVQGFNKEIFEVSIVLLDSNVSCYNTDLEQVRIIDLKTIKASKSFFAMCRLLREEKPYAVFSTLDHMNLLMSFVARFVKGPIYIARVSNIPSEQIQFVDLKTKFYALFSKMSYQVFNKVICQTEYMQDAIVDDYNVSLSKTVVIHNPLRHNSYLKQENNPSKEIKLIVVARLALEKGLDRLIDTMASLPEYYSLSIVGVGALRQDLEKKVQYLNLDNRVKFYGQITNVQELMLQHDLFVLSSHTEGFPNVVLESLSVGLPVVTYQVSGTRELIRNGFNGYVVPQNDLVSFREKIILATTKQSWDRHAIKAEVYSKFALERVTQVYEQLIK